MPNKYTGYLKSPSKIKDKKVGFTPIGPKGVKHKHGRRYTSTRPTEIFYK